jgi:hypothetical protein
MSWIITGTQKNNWTPADIDTALWLDAADASTISTSGNEVTQINDKSGNGRNFTGASGTRPSTGLATLNGKNVLGFTGDYLTSTSPASTWTFLHDATGSSCFCVVEFGVVASPNAAYILYGTNNASTNGIGKAIYYDDRASISRNDALVDLTTKGQNLISVISNVSGNGFISPNTYNLLTLHSSPNSAIAADRSELIVNAGTPAKNNTATNSLSTASPTYTLQIGAGGNGSLPLTGELAEFIFVSGVASLDTQQKMEGYLAHKWGLTANLPAGHPYKTAVPVP